MTVKRIARSATWVLVAVVVLYHIGAALYFSNRVLESGFDPAGPEAPAPPSGVGVQQVTYESELGALDAWYLPSFRSTWVIHVHGKDGTLAQSLNLLAPLQDAGYPQLAITYRNDAGQPVDPSGVFGYGLTEAGDVGAAVDYALANGAGSVVLSGYGGGASLILAYLYRSNEERVEAVMFDSPIVDMSAVVDHWLTGWTIPGIPFPTPPTVSPFARFVASLTEEINWRRIDYVSKASAQLQVPVLSLHGTADDVSPITQSSSLAGSAPGQVLLVPFEGAGHLASFDADPEKYLDEVLSFLTRVG